MGKGARVRRQRAERAAAAGRDAELRAAGFTVVRDGGELDVRGTVTAGNAGVLARAVLIEQGALPEGWPGDDGTPHP